MKYIAKIIILMIAVCNLAFAEEKVKFEGSYETISLFQDLEVSKTSVKVTSAFKIGFFKEIVVTNLSCESNNVNNEDVKCEFTSSDGSKIVPEQFFAKSLFESLADLLDVKRSSSAQSTVIKVSEVSCTQYNFYKPDCTITK